MSIHLAEIPEKYHGLVMELVPIQGQMQQHIIYRNVPRPPAPIDVAEERIEEGWPMVHRVLSASIELAKEAGLYLANGRNVIDEARRKRRAGL